MLPIEGVAPAFGTPPSMEPAQPDKRASREGSVRVGPVFAPKDHAGFIRRTLALLIDFVILLACWIAMAVVWQISAEQEWISQDTKQGLLLSYLIGCVVYAIGFRLTLRGTPGYRLVGIRYVYMLDEKPGILAVLFRAVAAVALLWGFALDHIWILFDKRKQAWHDKLSGFYVVKKNAQPIGTERIVRRVIYFYSMAFVVWEPASTATA